MDKTSEPLEQIEQIAEHEFDKEELEAADDLLKDCFGALPPILQEIYGEVLDFYRQRRFVESNRRFDDWMVTAKKLGVI